MGKKLRPNNFHNFIIFDCETGGLDKQNQEHAKNFAITQISLIGLNGDSLEEIQRYTSYIKGKWVDKEYKSYDEDNILKYDKEALLYTRLSIEKLDSQGKDVKQIRKDIKAFFNEIHKDNNNYTKPILVGHNVIYDIPFLQKLFWLEGESLESYLQGYKDPDGVFHPVYLDTMFLSRIKYLDKSGKHSLTDACNRESIELIDMHDAEKDAEATVSLFKKFIHYFRSISIAGNNSKNDEQVQKRGHFRKEFKF